MNAYIFITVLIVIASILVTLVVLVQNSKGGGLASNFQSSNQFMGVRRTADFLEKFTWGAAIAILALSLLSITAIPRGAKNQSSSDTEIRKALEENAQPIKDFQPAPAKK